MPAIQAKQTSKKSVSTVDKLTIAETAAELRSCTDFVRDEIRRRKLAFHRFGWRILISRDDLEDYLRRTRTAAYGEKS
jgi:excisionase family DNA binding protein